MKNNFLLDTHAFIWVMEGGKRLPETVRKIISDPVNEIFVSAATFWEIIIKKRSNKIRVSFNLETSARKAGFELIPIEISHVLYLEKLPLYHKDPFDRILISQAKIENLILITADKKIWRYKLNILKT